MFLLGLTSPTCPLPFSPSGEEIAAFTQNNFGGPSRTYFRPDFTQPLKRHAWNMRLTDIFLESFKDFYDGDCPDDDTIVSEFAVHFQYLKTKYKHQLDRTPRSRRNARRMRRITLHQSRLSGCLRFTQMDKFLAWVELLGSDAMSEDESDREAGARTGNRTYKVKTVFWRSQEPEFLAFLEVLDVLHMSMKFTDEGIPHPGNWPRMRIRDGGEPKYKMNAVAGLPRNFYDADFLQSLSGQAKILRKLNVQPPIDLAIDPRIIQWMQVYLPALSSESPQPVSFPPTHSAMQPRSLPEVMRVVRMNLKSRGLAFDSPEALSDVEHRDDIRTPSPSPEPRPQRSRAATRATLKKRQARYMTGAARVQATNQENVRSS